MDKNIRNELEQWVKKNYKQYVTGWICKHFRKSETVFYDAGREAGRAWAAYEIGSILGMDLEDPDIQDD